MSRYFLYAAVCMTAMITVDPLLAQDVASESGIADIVVTARKTEERMQEVPVAVTALSGAALQQRTI